MIQLTNFFQLSINGTLFDRVAWTGGDWPPKWLDRHHTVKEMTKLFFREQMAIFIDAWEDMTTPTDVPKDVQNTFWTRAKADAWRTFTRNRKLLESC